MGSDFLRLPEDVSEFVLNEFCVCRDYNIGFVNYIDCFMPYFKNVKFAITISRLCMLHSCYLYRARH